MSDLPPIAWLPCLAKQQKDTRLVMVMRTDRTFPTFRFTSPSVINPYLQATYLISGCKSTVRDWLAGLLHFCDMLSVPIGQVSQCKARRGHARAPAMTSESIYAVRPPSSLFSLPLDVSVAVPAAAPVPRRPRLFVALCFVQSSPAAGLHILVPSQCTMLPCTAIKGDLPTQVELSWLREVAATRSLHPLRTALGLPARLADSDFAPRLFTAVTKLGHLLGTGADLHPANLHPTPIPMTIGGEVQLLCFVVSTMTPWWPANYSPLRLTLFPLPLWESLHEGALGFHIAPAARRFTSGLLRNTLHSNSIHSNRPARTGTAATTTVSVPMSPSVIAVSVPEACKRLSSSPRKFMLCVHG